VACFQGQGYKVQFEVNGQVYFLNFAPGEGRWFVLTPTHDGFFAMAVVDDDDAMLFPDAPVVASSDRDLVH
jgi:hypothetical protein